MKNGVTFLFEINGDSLQIYYIEQKEISLTQIKVTKKKIGKGKKEQRKKEGTKTKNYPHN